ncbi:MAG TPA: hypothetical protein DCX14_08010 [Flavobacteriales bacterium]|nr:hypothetical protein [Flavobacteriales bacterium]
MAQNQTNPGQGECFGRELLTITMKILTLLLFVWGVIGFAVFVWDTLIHEDLWSRNQDSNYLYLWCGPIIWGLYVFLWFMALICHLIFRN